MLLCVTQGEEAINREGISVGTKTRKKTGRQIFLKNFYSLYYCNSLAKNPPILGSCGVHVIRQGIVYTLGRPFWFPSSTTSAYICIYSPFQTNGCIWFFPRLIPPSVLWIKDLVLWIIALCICFFLICLHFLHCHFSPGIYIFLFVCFWSCLREKWQTFWILRPPLLP